MLRACAHKLRRIDLPTEMCLLMPREEAKYQGYVGGNEQKGTQVQIHSEKEKDTGAGR